MHIVRSGNHKKLWQTSLMKGMPLTPTMRDGHYPQELKKNNSFLNWSETLKETEETQQRVCHLAKEFKLERMKTSSHQKTFHNTSHSFRVDDE